MSSPNRWTENRVAAMIGLDLPIVQGPFGGGLSSVDLVAAVSNAGALGSFGANLVPAGEIGGLVAELRGLTDAPFNVNLWVPLPDEEEVTPGVDDVEEHLGPLKPYFEALGIPRSAVPSSFVLPSFKEQVAELLDAAPPVISFVFGVPPAEVLAAARRKGSITMGTATTVTEAEALDTAGIDIVIASGSDAGGHRGSFLGPAEESLVGTLSLVPQVVDAVSAPVVAAGGIADLRQVEATFALGAEGVQIGTAFLATDESPASAEHKDVLTGDPRATVLTSAFSGRPARVVPNELTRALDARATELAGYPLQGVLTAPIRYVAGAEGRLDYASLWAGQSAGLCRSESAAAYIERLRVNLAAGSGSTGDA
jgi:nitronate monooxygenase